MLPKRSRRGWARPTKPGARGEHTREPIPLPPSSGTPNIFHLPHKCGRFKELSSRAYSRGILPDMRGQILRGLPFRMTVDQRLTAKMKYVGYSGGGLEWGLLSIPAHKTPTLALPRHTGGGKWVAHYSHTGSDVASMNQPLNIGFIGLDTSHVSA